MAIIAAAVIKAASHLSAPTPPVLRGLPLLYCASPQPSPIYCYRVHTHTHMVPCVLYCMPHVSPCCSGFSLCVRLTTKTPSHHFLPLPLPLPRPPLVPGGREQNSVNVYVRWELLPAFIAGVSPLWTCTGWSTVICIHKKLHSDSRFHAMML